MGYRSRRQTFRHRRQQAGFAVFATLVVLSVGGLALTGLDTFKRLLASEPVRAVETPDVAGIPEAASDIETRREAGEPIPVPDIPYNATEEEARKLLERSGLELGDVEKEINEVYDKGGVFWQDPLPGIEVERGSSVGITISSGEGEKKEDGGGDPDAPPTNDLYLTVPKLGLYDNVVANTEDPVAMDQGAIKLPSTAFPWQENGNTYIAAHRIGYAGTESFNQFYNLPSMERGDEVILSDAEGTTYTYEVVDVKAVMPQDNWVTDPVPGKDMVSLQTCIATLDDWWTITPGLLSSPPGPETARLVVQAERVDVERAS